MVNLDRNEKWFEHPDHIAHERAIDEAAGRIRPVANLPPPEASAEERDKALARALRLRNYPRFVRR